MSEQKRFTAQEMREMANAVLNECWDEECGLVYESSVIAGHVFYPDEAAAMLRQAADAEDELAKLKAQMEAVVKECSTDFDMRCKGCPCESVEYCELTCGQVEEIVNKRQKDILRLARGDGGAE